MYIDAQPWQAAFVLFDYEIPFDTNPKDIMMSSQTPFP
jgi:hypothetical protein